MKPDGLARLWGRHKGHPLRPRQAGLIESLLPRLSVPVPEEGQTLDPRRLDWGFEPAAIGLEIGFGGGEHLIALAKSRPDMGFLGAEHFLNGLGKILSAIEEAGLGNVRLHAGDARLLLERLAPQSLSSAYVLFPDPWPKKRHWKRRFVQDETLLALARALAIGGVLRIASDIPDYIAWTREHLARRPEFALARDLGERPQDWPPTRYERKAIAAGRTCTYLEFHRLPGTP